MIKNSKSFLISILFLSIVFHVSLLGQATHSISTFISIPPIQDIQIQSNHSFPEIYVQDINNGHIDIDRAVRLTVFSNVPWRIVIRSSSENLYVSPGRFKSVNDLKWRVGSQIYQSLSGVVIVVARSNQPAKNEIIEVDYRLIIGWKNTPPGRWEVDPEFRIEPLPGGF